MRLTVVSRSAGLKLARDIAASDPNQMPILRAGATITPRYIEALLDLGIHAVWVDDALSAGIVAQELVPPVVRQQTARAVTQAVSAARTAFDRRQPLDEKAANDLKAIVEQLAASIAHRPDVTLFLNDLASADAYTHQHSIDVTALGLLIGRTLFEREGWHDFRGERRWDDIPGRLIKLGMGLLLHDIGKMAVPSAILNKPDRLTPEEQEVMREHPETGAGLLEADHISPLVRAVVREHHERWDGSGYPQGLAGDRINELARICAVADVYDAITSQRPYKPAAAPYVGVGVVVDGCGTAFDPAIVDIFERVVPPFPVGSEITLPDGSIGVVARIEEKRPVVRLPDGEGWREVRVGEDGDLALAA
jgi:HD-GYP domain-containing protein (c-di-GMP phosphodiesterase class II)